MKMTTITSLHALWQARNNHFKEHGSLWQQNTWWGFSPPLAINPNVPFSQPLAPIWLDAIERLLNNAFEYISQNNYPDDADPKQDFDGWECAEKILDEMGFKSVLKPNHLDKSLAKHERYKHYIFVVRQLWLSAYNSEYELSKKPWTPTSFLIKPENPTAAFYREASKKRLEVPQRDQGVFDECNRVAHKLGFASISAASVVPNEIVLEILKEIEVSSDVLYEKFGVPHTAAGFNGVNFMINPPANHMGRWISYNNSIVITMREEKKYASSFWHEWTHMLEDQTLTASNMRGENSAWLGYKKIAPILQNMHKALRRLPQGDLADEPVFNMDPFFTLRNTIKNLATNAVFKPDVNQSLLHEFENGVALDANYSFTHVMERRAKHKKDPQGLCVLFKSWRAEDSAPLVGFTDEYHTDDGYDEKSNMLVSYTTALRNKKSQYIANAIALDNGAHGDYWSASHELLARATQSYFEAVGVAQNSYPKTASLTSQEIKSMTPCFNELLNRLKCDFSSSNLKHKIHTKRLTGNKAASTHRNIF